MLIIPKLISIDEPSTQKDVFDALSKTKRHGISTINWNEYPYKPQVAFQAGHVDNGIYLRFFVRESFFRAKHTVDFEAVWTDSCVEFFVSLDDDPGYYNFEFNGIGTALLCYGTDRHDRQQAPLDTLNKVVRHPSFGKKPIENQQGDLQWDLMVYIPIEAFFNHQLTSLTGKTMRANFYKCGDELAVPHYLTWSPIASKKPDFHRPEFFREIWFIDPPPSPPRCPSSAAPGWFFHT